MFDAILWDNDGVLVDTEPLYFQATAEALAQVGVTLTEADYVEFFLRRSQGAFHLARERGVPAEAISSLRAVRDARYVELIDASDPLLPGAKEAVLALAPRHRMAIVTSSQPAPFFAAHAKTGLLPYFELTLTRVDYAESKPDPEPYLLALARLGLAPERCLVIEDSERGLAAARAAGLRCWIVPSSLSAGSAFEGAERIFSNLGQVVSALSA